MGEPTPTGPLEHHVRVGPEDTFVAVGMRGTGKTELCKRIAASWSPNVVVWDPLAQYPPAISFRPPRIDTPHLEALSAWAWQTRRKLLLEEAEQVLGEEVHVGRVPLTKAYCQMSRNFGGAFGANVRRPQAVKKFLLDEADHLFIFKLGGRALSYMMEYVGGREGRQLERMRGWVKDPRQGGGRFYHYHDGELWECPRLRLP